ncbi:hypothetical protein HHI36_014121 [Cryptolaemus montrouzieri]|uniref:HMG box domain-containing protein n=1 Tax=Cryptolaemus montrouzieri TaxID=559131 RepID=A0ABD2N1V2_9CUCU
MRDAASETRLLQQKLSSITSHPFVNFFLELCKSRDGLNLDDLARKAGHLWREMEVSEKVPYYRLARKVKRIAKSKNGRDIPRSRIRKRRRRIRAKSSSEPLNTEKPPQETRKVVFSIKEPNRNKFIKEDDKESICGTSTDCNSVENYCLDVLRRRYSHSSTYESD